MKEKKARNLVCPNCFGTTYREVLVTPTSRNVDFDEMSPPTTNGSRAKANKHKDVIKLLCVHCGHEVDRNGGRA